MQSPCYRCGTQLEDRTTFCPSCGAPQIKVAAPEGASTNEPSILPLHSGMPDSIQPLPLPINLDAGKIQWKRYRRIALSLSAVTGICIAFFAPLGLPIFLGAIVYTVGRYRRECAGHLSALQGAKLGAFNGFVSFVAASILQAAFDHGEYRRLMTLELQRRFAGNPDPQVQQFAHWAASDAGFLALMLFSLLFLLAIFLIVSSFAGALTATFSSNRQRR
jgi:hypothetical protein